MKKENKKIFIPTVSYSLNNLYEGKLEGEKIVRTSTGRVLANMSGYILFGNKRESKKGGKSNFPPLSKLP